MFHLPMDPPSDDPSTADLYQQKTDKNILYLSDIIRTAMAICLFSASLMYMFVFASHLVSLSPITSLSFAACFLALCFLIWGWATDSVPKKEKERFFFFSVVYMLMCIPALLCGNPWPLFMIANSALLPKEYLAVSGIHLCLFLVSLYYKNTVFANCLEMLPVLVALLATLSSVLDPKPLSFMRISSSLAMRVSLLFFFFAVLATTAHCIGMRAEALSFLFSAKGPMRPLSSVKLNEALKTMGPMAK